MACPFPHDDVTDSPKAIFASTGSVASCCEHRRRAPQRCADALARRAGWSPASGLSSTSGRSSSTGCLRVEHEGGELEVRAGQAVLVNAGEWVRYTSPEPDGAEYVAVCLPAFAPDTVHRDG